jgi:hypothetical protein
VVEVAIGVVLGFVSAVGHDALKSWQRARRLWKVVLAAALLCEKRANNYINRTVPAPLYRLPTMAFREALPFLMSDAGLTDEEYTALVEFFEWADDINQRREQFRTLDGGRGPTR